MALKHDSPSLEHPESTTSLQPFLHSPTSHPSLPLLESITLKMQPTNTYHPAQTWNHRILLWSQQSSPLSTLPDLDPTRRTKRTCTVHTHAISGETILTNIAMQRFTPDQASRNFSQYVQCVKGKCQICKHSTVYGDYEAEKAREVEHGDVEGRLVRRRGGLFDPVDRLRAFGGTPANPIVIRDTSADSHLSERAKRWLED